MSNPSLSVGKWQRIWLLFWTFVKIATFVVGGGLAMLPVIEEVFVTRRKILTQKELLDLVTITQTVPGIVAVNSAVYVGMKIAGITGAIAAVLGAVLPSFLIILTIAWLFPHLRPDSALLKGAFAGVRAAVTGMLLVTAVRTLGKNYRNLWESALVVLAFCLIVIFQVNPAWIILGAMPLGLLLLRWEKRNADRRGT